MKHYYENENFVRFYFGDSIILTYDKINRSFLPSSVKNQETIAPMIKEASAKLKELRIIGRRDNAF